MQALKYRVDKNHYKDTANRLNLIKIMDISIDDLYASEWQLDKSGTKQVKILDSTIYKAVKKIENDEDEAKVIYKNYGETIFLYNNYRIRKPWLTDFTRLKNLYYSVKENGYDQNCLIQIGIVKNKYEIIDGHHRASVIRYINGSIIIPTVFCKEK